MCSRSTTCWSFGSLWRKKNATKGKTLKKRRGRTESSCPQKGIARKILKRLGAQSVTLAVVDNQIMFLSSIAFPRHQLSCRPFPYPCLTTNKMILLPNPIKTQVVLNVWFISFVEMRQTQCHYRVLPSCYLLNTWRTLYHITGSVFHGLVFPSISFSILEWASWIWNKTFDILVTWTSLGRRILSLGLVMLPHQRP